MDFGSFAPKSYKPNNQTPTPGGLNAVDHFKQASLELASIIGHKDHFLFSEKYGTVSNVLRIFGVMGLPPECHETTNLRICQLGVENTSTNERRSRYGDNTIGYGARYGICFFALESIKSDKTIQLLIGAATLSVILSFFAKQKEAPSSCGWIEGVAIILSVLIVTTVNAVNEFYKQDQFLFVHQEEDSHRKPITVWRYHRLDEHHQNSLELRAEEVPMAELVVGDIVRVSSGCQLTFDAILIYNNDSVVVDEVCISGESEERRKEASDDCFLISGSSVLEGSSESAAVVCAVGASSFSGSIAEFISSTEKEDTPLQKQLGVLADSIARYGIGAALATCAILILKDILSAVTAGAPLTWSKILSNVITAVTIVVVAVPEGLPLSVTIALAYSMRQMLQDGNLVRHLAACETMGGATVLCIDKTGTLTQPTMRVSHIVLGLVNYPCPSSLSGSKAKDIVRISWSSSQIQLFLDSIVWCSLDPQLGVPVNKTAEALLKMDIEFQSLEGIHHISATLNSVLTFPARKFRRFPINSIDKIGRTIIFHSDKQCHFLCGAPEIVLSISDKYVNEQGLEETLTDSSRAQHQQVVDQLSSAGHRAVCFAYTCKCADASEVATSQMRYCLLGVIALEEKLQSDAVVALEQCRSAGIRVIMITGDSRLTAVNVALRCGLFCTSKDNPYTVIDGPDFRKMRDAELIGTYLPFLCVLSRASPLDKKRLLQLLRMYNPMDVIAMTGDGTNDAPALKLSDVGFAMESGSDVAKKASDIILLGNSFSGMVRAVIWGRGIKDNIRKFLQYQLTVNVGACLIAFLGAVVNDQNISPLKPVQLLWLNLIMDSLAALALATELPTADLLRRSPESQGTPIITQPMWISVWVQCTCQLLVQFLLFWFGFGLLRSEDNHHRFSDLHICFLFNSFVWMQIFNFFNARLLDSRLPLFWGFQYSRTLLYIVGFIAVVQFVVVQYGGQWMMTVPLSYMEWIYSIAIGLLALPSGKLSRWVCCQAENSRQTFFPRLLLNILRSARKEKSKFRTAYP